MEQLQFTHSLALMWDLSDPRGHRSCCIRSLPLALIHKHRSLSCLSRRAQEREVSTQWMDSRPLAQLPRRLAGLEPELTLGWLGAWQGPKHLSAVAQVSASRELESAARARTQTHSVGNGTASPLPPETLSKGSVVLPEAKQPQEQVSGTERSNSIP